MTEASGTIQHVSDTARWVALYRAIESERPEPESGRRSEPSTSVVDAFDSREPPGTSAARVGSSMRVLASSSELRNCE